MTAMGLLVVDKQMVHGPVVDVLGEVVTVDDAVLVRIEIGVRIAMTGFGLDAETFGKGEMLAQPLRDVFQDKCASSEGRQNFCVMSRNYAQEVKKGVGRVR